MGGDTRQKYPPVHITSCPGRHGSPQQAALRASVVEAVNVDSPEHKPKPRRPLPSPPAGTLSAVFTMPLPAGVKTAAGSSLPYIWAMGRLTSADALLQHDDNGSGSLAA